MTSFCSRLRRCRLALSPLLLTVLLTACGGGNDAPANYPLGGSVTGLSGGTLILQVNDGETVSVSADGAFQFPTELPGGSRYTVSVQTQPNNPAQTCSVNRGSGTLNAAVTDIAVLCAPNAYHIGGTVSGLAGSGLVLQNNGGDDLTVAADGGFRFTQPVASGARYSITVKTQPSAPAQTCTVNDASAIVADHDIDNVTVQCSTDVHQIGGSVTGLTGKGLVLQNNAGDDLAVDTDGHFQFATPVASGAGYVVTVRTQPGEPSQTCSVDRATGTVADQDITDVKVQCATNAYRIGGTVSGLAGSGLVLQNNGGDDLVVNANGSFRFAQPVASGAAYAVTVRTQPVASGAIVKTQPIAPAQTCTVSQTSSIVGNADVTDVQVRCSTNGYTVGGTVSGYSGSGLVLRNNGGNALPIAANGAFRFTQPIISGTGYTVTVATQPAGQTCDVVGNGSGTMGNANVTNVQITCTANPAYTIGGTVLGIAGSGSSLVLQNNGGDDVAIAADGSFQFPTAITGGLNYAVTVKYQPRLQDGACTITSNGSGTVTGNVSNVTINCGVPSEKAFAYVTNSYASNLSAYAIDYTSGALTMVANPPMDSNVTDSSSVVTDPARKFAYVVNPYGLLSNSAIFGYTIDHGTGDLVPMPGSPFASSGSTGLTVHPGGQFAYAVNANVGTVSVFAIDPATGALSPVPDSTVTTGASPSSYSIAIEPTGRFAYVGNFHANSVSVYTIGADGKLTAMAGSPFPTTGGNVQTISITPNGRFMYVTNWAGTVAAYRIAPDSGALTLVMTDASGSNNQTSVIDPTGKFLYVVHYSDQNIDTYTIDAATGALTKVPGSPFSSGTGYPKSFTLDPTGRFAYATSYFGNPLTDLSFYTIDPATGVITLRPPIDNGVMAGAVSTIGW